MGTGIVAAVDHFTGGVIAHITDLRGGRAVAEQDQGLVANRDAVQRLAVVQQVAAQDQTGLDIGAPVGQVISA